MLETGINRLNFASLDALHAFNAVMKEFDYVPSRQSNGDLVIFDDVTPGKFNGVVSAQTISDQNNYGVERLTTGVDRDYAIANEL